MSDKGQDRRITLRDIAEELGVSHTAVSLALRNRSGISNELRIRITEKAAEMGYYPDPMLAALSNYCLNSREHPVRSGLAWINHWENPDELRTYHEFDLYWQGAYKTAHNLGYHLEEYTIKKTPLRRLEQILKARNVHGLLIPPGRFTNVNWEGFDWSHFSVVRFGRTDKPPALNFVTSAQTQNAMLAFKEIHKRGYQRIGFVGEDSPGETFGAGFFWAQRNLPARQHLPQLLFAKTASDAEREAALDRWVKENRPDAIFTREPKLPQQLANLGYRVPEDIGLATTSVIDTPIDSGIDQNSEEIGRSAVLMVVSHINDFRRGIPPIQHEYLINGRWIQGTSLPGRNR